MVSTKRYFGNVFGLLGYVVAATFFPPTEECCSNCNKILVKRIRLQCHRHARSRMSFDLPQHSCSDMVGRSRMLLDLQQHSCSDMVGRSRMLSVATTFLLREFRCSPTVTLGVECCSICNNILVTTFAKSLFVQATAPGIFSANGDREPPKWP